MYLSQSSTSLSFVVNNENRSTTQCYGISANFEAENICDLFRQSCSSVNLRTELFKSNESYSVSIIDGKAEIVVEIPDKCKCLSNEASPTSDNSNKDAVIAASTLSALMALVITGVIVVLIFYCRKTKSLVIEE